MSRIILMLCAVSMAAASLPFCKKDPFNCKDEKVGDVYFSEESKSFFPDMGTGTVVFENGQGQSKTYSLVKHTRRIPLHVEKLCESLNLSSHYRYMDGDLLEFRLLAQTDSILVQMSMVSCALKGKKDTCFYDLLSVSRFDNQQGVSYSKIISFRGHNSSSIPQSDLDAQTARFVGDTTLLGVPYQQVWAAGWYISDNPATLKQDLFLADGHGIIGFKDDSGVLWRKRN